MRDLDLPIPAPIQDAAGHREQHAATRCRSTPDLDQTLVGGGCRVIERLEERFDDRSVIGRLADEDPSGARVIDIVEPKPAVAWIGVCYAIVKEVLEAVGQVAFGTLRPSWAGRSGRTGAAGGPSATGLTDIPLRSNVPNASVACVSLRASSTSTAGVAGVSGGPDEPGVASEVVVVGVEGAGFRGTDNWVDMDPDADQTGVDVIRESVDSNERQILVGHRIKRTRPDECPRRVDVVPDLDAHPALASSGDHAAPNVPRDKRAEVVLVLGDRELQEQDGRRVDRGRRKRQAGGVKTPKRVVLTVTELTGPAIRDESSGRQWIKRRPRGRHVLVGVLAGGSLRGPRVVVVRVLPETSGTSGAGVASWTSGTRVAIGRAGRTR